MPVDERPVDELLDRSILHQMRTALRDVLLTAVLLVSISTLPACNSTPANSGPKPTPTMPPTPSMPTPATTEKPGKSSPTLTLAVVDPVIARLDGVSITRSQLVEPLIESHGLDLLMQVTQLQMARDEATRRGITLTDTDVTVERDRTLKQIFVDVDPKEYESVMDQLLSQQRLTRREFAIVIETNAFLRALARPTIQGAITDANLLEAFNTMYGQRVRVRHIAVNNMQELQAAQKRLAAGEDFSAVARSMSRSPISKDVGGEMPPFARTTAGIDPAFAETAFALQPGQISNPVNAGGLFHLIKLEEKLAPRTQKFEDVKNSIRAEVEDRALIEAVRVQRREFAERALRNLRIDDPILGRQFDQKLSQANSRSKDRAAVAQQLKAKQEQDARQAAENSPLPEPAPILPPTPESTTRQASTSVTTQPATTEPAR